MALLKTSLNSFFKIVGVIIFVILMLGIPMVLYFNSVRNSNQNNKDYFESFNISFSGIVKSKKHISNGAGIITLEVSQSSLEDYDVRDKFETYLCVIKRNKAEVIMNRLFLIKIGDSLVVDSNTRKLNLFRSNTLKESWDFQLPINTTFFYDLVRINHEL